MILHAINRKDYIAALASGKSTEQIVEGSRKVGEFKTKMDLDLLKVDPKSRNEFPFVIQENNITPLEEIEFD